MLKEGLRDQVKNNVINELNKVTKEIEMQGVYSPKFWKTVKKLQWENHEEPELPYVIDSKNNNEVIRDPELGIQSEANYWTLLYKCREMVERYKYEYQNIKYNNKRDRDKCKKTNTSPFDSIILKRFIKNLKRNKAI